MKRKIIVIGIIVIIAAGIAIKLVANKKAIDSQKKKTDNTEIKIPVNTVTTHFQAVEDSLVKSGTLIPYKEADITAVSGGKLVSVSFELGDYVSQGKVLATVDNTALKLQLEAAELTEKKAEKDFHRFKVLLEGEATTKQNYQDAMYNYNNAKNQIEQIKKQMADNRIKAPISGQIVSKEKENGEFVSAGMVLGHIVDVNRLKVDVMVNEEDVYSLKTGEPVTVTTDVYPGVAFNGKIIFISEKGGSVHNYKVEVLLHNKKNHPLRAGSFAYVNFNQPTKEKQMLIPKSALIQSLDKPMVYVIKDGKAKIRDIKVGQTHGNQIAVVSGLKPDEQVITTGLINVADGTPVNPVQLSNQ